LAAFQEPAVSVDNELLEDIRAAAVAAYPNEACGLIIAGAKKAVAVTCKNIATDPTRYFLLDPNDYARYADQGDVLAVWHTHPEASSKPSETDVAGIESTEMEWWIQGLKKDGDQFVFDELSITKPTGYQAPYVGRPYLFAIYDCYSLVRDYYKREFGLVLNDYPRIEEWWKRGHDFFGQHFVEEGFELLMNVEPIPGDVFLIQAGADVPNHVAIYVGNDQILHHCISRLSRHEVYGHGYWHKHTTHHLRHKSKC
jgi:proteasome lid subunit RPN8/RPN11